MAFGLQNHRKTQFHTANHVHFFEQQLWNVCENLHFISLLAKFAVTFVDAYSKFIVASFFRENTKHYLMASVLYLHIYVAVTWRELRVMFVSVIFDLHFRRRHETYLFLLRGYTDKKKSIFFHIRIRKFRVEQLQSHIWLTASLMGKYLRISSYIRKLFLIYDFGTAPLWISLYMRKIRFSFLSV